MAATRRTGAVGLLFLLILLLTAWTARAQAPTISSLSTTSGPAGTVVTVNGTNLSNIRSVVLRGIPCNVTPISASQASFVVPAQASTGPIRLTTTGGNVLSSSFTVTRASTSLTYMLRSSSFNGINVGAYSTPAVTDLDHDGLIDLLVGREIDGLVSHYEQSAAGSTSFTLRATNLSGLTGHYNSLVSVTDVDGDGLLEMVVGTGAGNFKHYEQTTANGTAFTQLSNDFNNIFSTGGTTYQIPHFTDLDGDGLLDLLVGDEFLSRYEQTSANGGTFTQLNNQNFGPTTDAGNGGAASCVVDLDGDGLLDMLVGTAGGPLQHYEQASANGTSFGLVSTAFSGLSPSSYSAPVITDLDGDGLLDLLVGGANGMLRHYEQSGSPTITSFTPTSGLTGTQVTITGTNLADVTAVTVNGTAGTIVGTPTNTSLTFTVGAGSTTGAVSVTAPGGTATGGTFTVTLPAPSVTSVAVPAGATYGIGDNLDFDVSFDQSVTVTTSGGTPTIGLTVGSTARTASYVSGSGTAILRFRYTVPVGDLDANGVVLGSAISLNGGTIRNAAAANASLTLTGVGNTANVRVDGVAPVPVISSSAGASGSSTATAPIPFAINFLETVSNFVIGDITVTNGTKSALTGSGSGPYTFTVTPTAPGPVTVNVGAAVATDAAGNDNAAATPFSITYAPATTAAPTVTSPADNSSGTDTTPTYSGTAPNGSTVTVYVNGSSIGTVTANAGNGNWSKTQSPALADGTYTVYATAQLSGQLVSANSNTRTFTIDNVDPTVTITSSAGAAGSTTNVTPVPFTVTFSEDVSGLAISEINVTGGTKSALTTVSASQYTFTVTPSGVSTITVNIASNRADDAAGNGNATAPQFSITYSPASTITGLSPAAELPGMPITITGTGFTAASTVTFDGVPAASFTFNSATSLTATVPAGVAVGSTAVVVTTGGAPSTNNPAFVVRKVYDATTSCLSTVSYTATGDGQWHYLLTTAGEVVAALQDTRAALGTVTVSLQATGSGSAVRQDGNGIRYLDRNFRLNAAGGNTFTGQTINVRFYGLTSEFARLQAVQAGLSYATLKVSQYSGPNEDCQLANNSRSGGETRILSLIASTPGGGVPWFVAQAAVLDHFSEFYLTGSSQPLPVELLGFTAEAQGAAVQLQWRTAQELNNAHFEVERSLDGQRFETIGQVAGQGSSTRATDYRFLDNRLPKALSSREPVYYRLRQVDLDGAATLSAVRTVTLAPAAGSIGLELYPRPVQRAGQLHYLRRGQLMQEAELTVYSVTGKQLATHQVAAGAAGTISTKELPAGWYLLRLRQADGSTTTARFLVQ